VLQCPAESQLIYPTLSEKRTDGPALLNQGRLPADTECPAHALLSGQQLLTHLRLLIFIHTVTVIDGTPRQSQPLTGLESMQTDYVRLRVLVQTKRELQKKNGK